MNKLEKNTHRWKKFFFILVVIFILCWLGQPLFQEFQFSKMSPAKKVESIWNEDILLLEKSHAVPKAWYQIEKVEITGGDDRAKQILSIGIQPNIKLKKQGSHRLEVLLLSFEEKSNLGIIVQYNLIDRKTKNMEWELGRTFYLNKNQNELNQMMNWFNTQNKKMK